MFSINEGHPSSHDDWNSEELSNNKEPFEWRVSDCNHQTYSSQLFGIISIPVGKERRQQIYLIDQAAFKDPQIIDKEERLKTQARLLQTKYYAEESWQTQTVLISIVDGDDVVIWNTDGVGKERRQQRYLVDQDIIIRFQWPANPWQGRKIKDTQSGIFSVDSGRSQNNLMETQ